MTTNECSKKKIVEKTSEYDEILDLAESGNTEEALVRIQEYLGSVPNDPEALNDTGAILFSLGHTEEAINHFLKANQLFPESAEIVWNLMESYLAENMPQKAMELLDKMDSLGILSIDVLNRTADILLKNENFIDAARVLRRSLQMSPQQKILQPMIDIINGKIPKEKSSN